MLTEIKKLSGDAENNTTVASAGSNKLSFIGLSLLAYVIITITFIGESHLLSTFHIKQKVYSV